MLRILLLTLGGIVVHCFSPSREIEKGFTKRAPSLEVNLDLPPRERWQQIAVANREAAIHMIEVWAQDFATLENDTKAEFLRKHNIPQEYVEELQGIVEAVNHPSMTMERLLSLQMCYELAFPYMAAGAGILAADSRGTVFHGRNYDYTFPANLTQNLIDVSLTRAGQEIATFPSFFPSIGVHTGMRIGGWSFQQNSRIIKAEGRGRRDYNLVAATEDEPGQVYGFVARKLLEEVPDFTTAVQRLAESAFMAPSYFLVAGAAPWEGAQITADREGHHLPYSNVEVLSPQIGRWFVVQTNEDAWGPPKDHRRPSAMASLRTLGQAAVGEDAVMEALWKEPVLVESTLLSWAASPASGTHHTWLRPEANVRRVELRTERMTRAATFLKRRGAAMMVE